MNGLVDRVREVYPTFQIEDAELIGGHGQNNDVLIVNRVAVFRFPRYSQGIARSERLVRILRALGPRVSAPIPEPRWLSLDDPTPGRAFVGYPLLPGQPLWMESFRGYPETVAQLLADQLALFLKSLHAVPPAEVLVDEPVAFDPLTSCADLYRRIRTQLFHAMRTNARDEVARHFESFLTEPRNRDMRPAFIHGDFGGSNILVDPETYRISGVIDFEGAGLGDPAVDLAAASGYGLERLAHGYPELEAYRERIDFYRGTFALQEALFGAESGDLVAYERGIAAYR